MVKFKALLFGAFLFGSMQATQVNHSHHKAPHPHIDNNVVRGNDNAVGGDCNLLAGNDNLLIGNGNGVVGNHNKALGHVNKVVGS